MMKGWNYAGGKVPARCKTGTLGRKLQAVRHSGGHWLGGAPGKETKNGPLKQHLMLLKSCRISVAGLVPNTTPSPPKGSYLTNGGM